MLLGDNMGGGAVMLQAIKFRCVGGWISIGRAWALVCVCMCIYLYTHVVGNGRMIR